MIAPNKVYDGFTGFGAGAACSTRDLVLDVHAALAKRGLKLLLYWTCDGPSGDREAHDALGWPDNYTKGCFVLHQVSLISAVWCMCVYVYSMWYSMCTRGFACVAYARAIGVFVTCTCE